MRWTPCNFALIVAPQGLTVLQAVNMTTALLQAIQLSQQQAQLWEQTVVLEQGAACAILVLFAYTSHHEQACPGYCKSYRASCNGFWPLVTA